MTISLREQYGSRYTGDNVTVYLVDSGIDATHKEFATARIKNIYTYDGSFDDTDGHGTGVASIIVGNTLGIVPNVTLKLVKVGLGSIGTFGQMIEAFTAILNDTNDGVSVVNCSWAVPKHHIIDDIIRQLHPEKFLVIAAAGNDMLPAKDFSPVSIDTVLGVGACDEHYQVISWKELRGNNWGPEVDITAIGIGVNVAVMNGEIDLASGTSLATAVISSIAAQYIQQFPNKTAIEIKELLTNSTKSNILIRDETIYDTTPNVFI